MRIFTIVSAMLLAATVVSWFRSYSVREGFWYSTDATRYGLHSHRGRVLAWSLSVAPNATAMTWASPAEMDRGFVHDATPIAWYDQFDGNPMATGLRNEFFVAPSNGGLVDRSLAGFRYVSNDGWYPRAQLPMGYPTARSRAVYVPHWGIALIASALPAWMLAKRRRDSRRRKRGLCVECGYDLRGSGAICPECGAGASAANSVTAS
jgi:hypothetical protein